MFDSLSEIQVLLAIAVCGCDAMLYALIHGMTHDNSALDKRATKIAACIRDTMTLCMDV